MGDIIGRRQILMAYVDQQGYERRGQRQGRCRACAHSTPAAAMVSLAWLAGGCLIVAMLLRVVMLTSVGVERNDFVGRVDCVIVVWHLRGSLITPRA